MNLFSQSLFLGDLCYWMPIAGSTWVVPTSWDHNLTRKVRLVNAPRVSGQEVIPTGILGDVFSPLTCSRIFLVVDVRQGTLIEAQYGFLVAHESTLPRAEIPAQSGTRRTQTVHRNYSASISAISEWTASSAANPPENLGDRFLDLCSPA